MKYPSCEKCPFISEPLVKSILIENSDILFVGQNPVAEDVRAGYPMCEYSDAGDILHQYLPTLNKKGLTYSITNAVKCLVVGEHTPAKKEASHCKILLDDEIALVNPKLIVALGKVALRSLTDSTESVTKQNGKVIYDSKIPILVCVHPSYVKHNKSNIAIFEKGILPALHFFDTVVKTEIVEMDTIEPTDEEVGFDIETTAFRPHDGNIRCFSISNGEKSIFINLEKK